MPQLRRRKIRKAAVCLQRCFSNLFRQFPTDRWKSKFLFRYQAWRYLQRRDYGDLIPFVFPIKPTQPSVWLLRELISDFISNYTLEFPDITNDFVFSNTCIKIIHFSTSFDIYTIRCCMSFYIFFYFLRFGSHFLILICYVPVLFLFSLFKGFESYLITELSVTRKIIVLCNEDSGVLRNL